MTIMINADASAISVTPTAEFSHPPMLSPAQARAMADVERMLDATSIVALAGPSGSGRSTILREVAARRGGLVLTVSDLVAPGDAGPADRSDGAIAAFVLDTLDRTDFLVIDDFDALMFGTFTARPNFMSIVTLNHLKATVEKAGKHLLFNGYLWNQFSAPADVFGHDAGVVRIPGFTVADYEAFAINIIGEAKASRIDFTIVHHFASMLSGHQLKMACSLIATEVSPDAGIYIDILRRHGIVGANTRTEQVEALDLQSLPGHEHIADRLMTNIILPLEHHRLAEDLGLRPKRGVLLYGPPGTGKTSIGRALAHRMKGKFFIIDGSFVSEPPAAFFGKVQKVVEEAKANSPSVLFIDDADVLFQIDHIAGLARYLLTLLDGLESETASNVCVMMTAMDVRQIPDALLRSGRVELWLETRLPTAEARANILKRWMSEQMPDTDIDYPALALATDGFTPADLRRLTGDAKALYAADLVRKRPLHSANDYVRQAIESIIEVRRRMARSLRDDSLSIDARSSGYGRGSGGLAETGSCASEQGW